MGIEHFGKITPHENTAPIRTAGESFAAQEPQTGITGISHDSMPFLDPVAIAVAKQYSKPQPDSPAAIAQVWGALHADQEGARAKLGGDEGVQAADAQLKELFVYVGGDPEMIADVAAEHQETPSFPTLSEVMYVAEEYGTMSENPQAVATDKAVAFAYEKQAELSAQRRAVISGLDAVTSSLLIGQTEEERAANAKAQVEAIDALATVGAQQYERDGGEFVDAFPELFGIDRLATPETEETVEHLPKAFTEYARSPEAVTRPHDVEGYVPPPTTLGVTEMVGEDLTRLEQQGRPTPAVAEVIKQRLAYAEAERRREERRSVLERAFTVFAEVRGGLTETQRQSIGR